MLNNPLMYIDPSGHEICDSDGYCGTFGSDELMRVAKAFGITFSGSWSKTYKWEVLIAASMVGTQLGEQLVMSGIDAFRSTFGLNDGDTLLFEWDPKCWGCREDPTGCDAGTVTGEACVSKYGYTNSENHIEFASMSLRSGLRRINNIIHELGHAFNNRLGKTPENAVNGRAELKQRPGGFYGIPGQYIWVQSPQVTGSEIFADQFIGWIHGLWGKDEWGPVRAEFMLQMNGNEGWVVQASDAP